jgi:hypothetical protein
MATVTAVGDKGELKMLKEAQNSLFGRCCSF